MRNNEKSSKIQNVAVLIDSENMSAKYVDVIMKESLRFGTLTIKRMYGDWTDSHMNKWKDVLPEYALHPIQQFSNTVGKNSTDSALIIDAMDILYTMPVDVFVIVSSDSDYTRLASHLQERSKYVVGIGEKKAPSSLQKSCNEFIFIENLIKKSEEIQKETQNNVKNKQEEQNKQQIQVNNNDKEENDIEEQENNKDNLLHLLLEAHGLLENNTDWINISSFSNKLRSLNPSFSKENYGYNQFYKVFQEFPDIFEIIYDEEKHNYFVRKIDNEQKDIPRKRRRRRKKTNKTNVVENAEQNAKKEI